MSDLIKKFKLISILKKQVKNWTVPLLFYFGLIKKEKVIIFKNGIKCIMRNKSDSIAFFEVFFLNTNDYLNEFTIKEKDIVVDIGAHIGYYSLYSSTKVKNGRVFAFEPFEESFEILIKNLELNQITNVVTQNMGVSHKSGSATLYLKKDFSIGNSIYQNTGTSSTVNIKTISLRDIIENNNLQKINILKLDCEGAEYEILLNLDNAILKKIDKIVAEIHPNIKNFKINDLSEFLLSNNFEVEIIYPLKNTPEELAMLYAKNKEINQEL